MGAIRIHFTVDDLARTYFVESASPKIELTLSLRAIRGQATSRPLVGWRHGLKGNLDVKVRPLLDLVPYGTVIPDFLDPQLGDVERGERLPQVVSTRSHQIRDYLALMAWRHEVPPATGRFGDGGAEVMRELGAAVTSYFDTAIRPYWNDVRSIVGSDRSMRARTRVDGGVERVLHTLHHTITWRPPVLRMALAHDYDGDVHLGGRGLRLQPSVFAGSQPVLWDVDAVEEPPTLVYPATLDGRSSARRGHASLVALIGRSRAQLLTAIADSPGITSGDLARVLHISPASASEQVTVLRNGGLVTTVRSGKSALHTITPLGAALLDQSAALVDPGLSVP